MQALPAPGLNAHWVTVKTATLAEKLGVMPQSSLLLKKAEGLGLHSPELLEALAVTRGCWHYRNPDLISVPTISESEFGNEELAVALLSPNQPYSPHTLRVGAAMLGATGNDVVKLVALGLAEQAIAPMRYIATAGLRFEPDNPFWRRLLESLPEIPQVPEGVMPHPTRFVSMTGMTRSGMRQVTVWVRPHPRLSLVHG